MTIFQLFDSVELIEEVALSEGKVAPVGTRGAIVDLLNNGEAYLVELFGGWVKPDEQGNLVPADRDDPNAFMETLGVETVYSPQLRLVEPAVKTVGARTHLLSVLDDLPENLVQEVADFAEFLRQKQGQTQVFQS